MNTLLDYVPTSDQASLRHATTIGERKSQELIFAFVGPVGSGVSAGAETLRELLQSKYSYRVCDIIKPSSLIKSSAVRVGKTPPTERPLDNYIQEMQNIGNRLREMFGGEYLSAKVIEKIYQFRRDNSGYIEGVEQVGRRAYIIDSIKNTEEMELLKSVYQDRLCVVGIFAPDEIRKARLINKGIDPLVAEKIMSRDNSEVMTFGQKTRKVFTNSDFFICNDTRMDELRARLERFLELVFGTKQHSPTLDEKSMFQAGGSSANSACMSRQVGASIVSNRGELISVGWNDVPKYGGGLYSEADQSVLDEESRKVDKDFRCFRWNGCVCHNETRRNDISEKIIKKIQSSGLLKKGTKVEDIRRQISGNEIESLIEFSRSIHAEMEAILSVAREGRHSLIGSTLYTNTYPCHNCARHIVAAGIVRVVFIEPYEKSLALALHSDSITESPTQKGKVFFMQYDGVAPKNFLRFFKPPGERKLGGAVLKVDLKTATPILQVSLDSQVDYESKVIADLAEKEETPATAG